LHIIGTEGEILQSKSPSSAVKIGVQA